MEKPAFPRVVFCVPGQHFTNAFVQCWTDLLLSCLQVYGVQPICPVFPYVSNIYIVRNICLLGDFRLGSKQKPFRGQIDYDFIMWIDSDSVFNPDDFKQLLDLMQQHPEVSILAGVYPHGHGDYVTAIKEDGLLLTCRELERLDEIHPVSYAGMGFMMVRKGVFEALEFPWFLPLVNKRFNNDENYMTDILGDDVAFCKRAKQAGFQPFLATRVRIGHEKYRVLEIATPGGGHQHECKCGKRDKS